MAILPLSSEEKIYLSRLDRNTKLALKKLFINTCFEKPLDYDVNYLAARKEAENIITDIFHDLDNIQPDKTIEDRRDNLV